MLEFLPSFFTSSSFIPHGHCYLWRPGLIWLHIISDSLIALAYYSIPITLVHFVQKRQDLPYVPVFLLFGAFSIACGTTHIMEVWTLWHPTYWLSGCLKALTALSSVYIAIVLVPILPQVLALPSPAQLEATNYQLLTEVLERRRIEEELRSSQQMLQLVIDNIPQFIYWKDRNSVYLGCNRSFAHAAGLDNPREIVGKTDHDLPWKSEEADYCRECDAHVMTIDMPEYHIIELSQEADGKQHWKDTNKIPLHDLKGNVVGLLSTVEDITERKQAETVRQRLNEELEVRVAERTAALSLSYQQLEAEISERQQAETALRRSEQRYRSLIEATSQIIWDTLADGEFVTEQPSWSAFTGQTTDELRGWGWLNTIHPDDQLHTTQVWSQAVTNGTFYEVEHRLQRNDGEYRYMSVRAVPMLEPDGSIREWVGVHTDITQRKLAEEALRQSEEKFRTIVENANDIIYLLKPNGLFFYVSPNWTDLLGHDVEAVEGKSFKSFLHPDDLLACQKFLELVLTTGQKQAGVEYQIKHKDGSWKWHTSNVSVLRDSNNEVLFFVGICRDITARKQREDELRFLQAMTQEIFASEDFHSALRIALQKVCEATGWNFGEAWIPHSDGTALKCSPAWYSNAESLEPFRRLSKELVFEPGIGLPGRVWLSKQPEWHRDVSAASDKTYLRAQMALESGLKAGLGIPIVADDRVLAVLVFYMFESKEQDQRLIELISASTELGLIMRRKQAEEEVGKALEQEKELSELKSRFISMTSHEFRTPLTTILSSAELLEDYGQGWSQEKKVEHLQRIQASVDRMTQLLNDVLSLGKAEAGKLECQSYPLNLDKFCRDLVEELQLGAGNKHTITFVKGGECTTACMDEKLLRQILSNLLSNALKYSPAGSTIQMTVSCQKGDVIFQIEDSGIGIPPEDQQRLFDPFHRAKNVGTIPGTGLGMAIVKKSVDLHGGAISVNSKVGVGTVFTVTLPLNQ